MDKFGVVGGVDEPVKVDQTLERKIATNVEEKRRETLARQTDETAKPKPQSR